MSSENIECPHCLVMIHVSWNVHHIATDRKIADFRGNLRPDYTEFQVTATQCPSCSKPIMRIRTKVEELVLERFIYPVCANRPAIDSDSLPQTLKDDYLEACNVLEISAKASAVLSRRVLQGILKERGYDSKNLYTQINNVLDEKGEKALPTHIKDTIHFVRRFGNFSAHPITEETTLQVVDIEDGEAEWCLQIIEGLFTHYYVEPDRLRERIRDAEMKLAEGLTCPPKPGPG